MTHVVLQKFIYMWHVTDVKLWSNPSNMVCKGFVRHPLTYEI